MESVHTTGQMDKRDFQYTACYCEENVCLQNMPQVYWLLTTLSESWKGDLYAVFMSNVNRSVPIWCNARSNGPVVWDYHVVAVGRRPTGDTVVFDLDSSLPFPCPYDLWVEQALRPQCEACQMARLRRRWRCVEAAPFLSHFASDRSHMFKQLHEDGEERIQWSSPPPPYQCISTQSDVNTLPQYWDMSDALLATPVSLSECHGRPLGILLEEGDFLGLLQPSGS